MFLYERSVNMPDSKELDEILKEIKSMNKSNTDNEKRHGVAKKENNAEVKREAPALQKKDVDLNSFSSDNTTPKRQHKEAAKMAKEKKSGNNSKIAIIVVAVIAVIAIAVGIAWGQKNKNEHPTDPTVTQQETTAEITEAPVSKTNPLTGSADFNENAVGKRPIAVVVENAAAARPQWGINDDKNPPDIIVEGEVEGGETRMLFMYADYTAVPSQIGPIRSARPPYIKFSELFDAIFLHWGQSQTKKGTAYIGANTVFRVDKVDHINQMTYSGKVALFGRDGSRGVSSEHTGVLYGDKIAAAIEGEGFRTEANQGSYTKFNFANEEINVGETECSSLGLTFSSRTRTRDWTFSDEDKMYHSSDYQTDVARKNLLVLYDATEYVAKANYKNSGSAEIYCNYKLSGGKGKLASNGTVVDITWSVENGVLVLKDANGADVILNTGTTWIGYASSNNGGADKIS